MSGWYRYSKLTKHATNRLIETRQSWNKFEILKSNIQNKLLMLFLYKYFCIQYIFLTKISFDILNQKDARLNGESSTERLQRLHVTLIIRRFQVQISLIYSVGLGTQPRYETPGGLRVDYDKSATICMYWVRLPPDPGEAK